MEIIHLTPEDTTKSLLKEGNAVFTEKPVYRLSVNSVEQLPIGDKKEFAFAGRSNVGKSSLINAVTGVKGLARASNTPGRTQSLNYFETPDFFIFASPWGK